MLFSSVLAFLAAPFMFKPAEVKPVTDWRDHKEPIDKLIGWLETKDPNETYNWWGPEGDACLLKQFGMAMGYSSPYMDTVRLFGEPNLVEPGAIAYGWHYKPGGEHNFGAALQRARAYKSKH